MAEEPDKHILLYLRRLDQKIDKLDLKIDKLDLKLTDLTDIVQRMQIDIGALRNTVSAMRHDVYSSLIASATSRFE